MNRSRRASNTYHSGKFKKSAFEQKASSPERIPRLNTWSIRRRAPQTMKIVMGMTEVTRSYVAMKEKLKFSIPYSIVFALLACSSMLIAFKTLLATCSIEGISILVKLTSPFKNVQIFLLDDSERRVVLQAIYKVLTISHTPGPKPPDAMPDTRERAVDPAVIDPDDDDIISPRVDGFR